MATRAGACHGRTATFTSTRTRSVSAAAAEHNVKPSRLWNVIRSPADTLESLAVNRLGEEGETFAATPAIADGAIFIRSDRHLWCFSEGGK